MILYFIPFLYDKTRNFLYPNKCLTDNIIKIINAMLYDFDILKINYNDGIVMIQTEINKKFPINRFKDIDDQIVDYFIDNFTVTSVYAGNYEYRGQTFKFGLIFIDIKF
jgi:hypothetical protein